MKTILQAIRKIETERKNPGKDKPLSPRTLRAMVVIIENDKALDRIERRDGAGYGI